MTDNKAYAHYPQSKSGGAAYPKPCCESHNGEEGMSLRDYFAGQVLASGYTEYLLKSPENLSKTAYDVADAMIKARALSQAQEGA